MARLGKYLSLYLVVILAVSSLLIVKTTCAESTTDQKPAPPEFTLTFIPASENQTHVDPLTGLKSFEIVDKSNIEVKIKNQHFDENINGVKYYLFYSIDVTGHFDPSNQSQWRTYYNLPYNYTTMPSLNTLQASNNEYTTVSIGGNYPAYSKIDVHVGVMLMHDGQFRQYDFIGDLYGHIVSGVVQGEANLSVQTFTIPEHLSSSIDSPNPTSVVSTPPTSALPSSPESPTSVNPSEQIKDVITIPLATFAAIIAVFSSVIIILLVLIFFRTRRQSPVLTSKSS